MKVFSMVSAKSMPTEIVTARHMAQSWINMNFSENDRIVVLFKNIAEAHRAYDLGFSFDKLNIGSLPGGYRKKKVADYAYLDESDAAKLQYLNERGCGIIFRECPDEKPLTWETIKNMYFSTI